MSTKSKQRGKAKHSGIIHANHRAVAAEIVGKLTQNAGIKDAMALPIPDLMRTEQALKHWMAFHLIKTSAAATHWTWMPLCGAVNIGMILAERGIGAEHMDIFFDAQDAIARAWVRAGEKGRARLDGPGFQQVVRALEVHDAQCEVAIRRELALAEREMIRRHNQGNTVIAEKKSKAA